jgi:hypothetical protein
MMRDDRPEREKYRRASLAEQAGDELRAFWGYKPVVALVAFILGGWLILTLTRPQDLTVGVLQAGDCLYIRAADANLDGDGRAIGTTSAAVDALYQDGAERAGCDASHSHEVAAAWVLEDAQVAPFPGQAALREREGARCEAAFEAHVGRPSEASAYELVFAVPPEDAWDEGARAAACLVANRDGSFLAAPARGSGR